MQPGVMSHEKWILKIRPGFLPKGTKLKEKALVKFHFRPFGKLEQNQIYPPTRSEHKLISLSPCALGSERSALKCWLLLPATRDSADRTVQHGRTVSRLNRIWEMCDIWVNNCPQKGPMGGHRLQVSRRQRGLLQYRSHQARLFLPGALVRAVFRVLQSYALKPGY